MHFTYQMGRSTTIIHLSIHIEFEGELCPNIQISKDFVAFLQNKYDIEFKWAFGDDGCVTFHSDDMCG